MHSQSPESACRDATTSRSDPGAVAFQGWQRSEIQAKLDSILVSLRSAPKGSPSVPQAGPASAPASMPSVAEMPGIDAAGKESGPDAIILDQPSAREPLTEEQGLPAGLRVGPPSAPVVEDGPVVEPSAVAEPLSPEPVPAWRVEIDRLMERLERIEAASSATAATLAGVMAAVESGQQNSVAAAQACARQEIRSVLATEVRPAFARLSGASTNAHREIHAVLSLLGTCLERVVQHVSRTDASATAALPVKAPEVLAAAVPLDAPPETPPAAAVPAILSEDRPVVAPGVAIPLLGLRRRSKLAALIDFGRGTRAA